MRCSRTVLATAFLYFLTDRMVREGVVGFRYILVDDHAAFLGDGLEDEGAACDRDFGSRSAMVPAKLLDEQRAEIEILQMFLDLVSVEDLRHFSCCPARSSPWSR